MTPENTVKSATAWLRDESTLVSARIAYLLRDKGINTQQSICAKVFPNEIDPTGGVIITPQGKVYQFSFNRAGMVAEKAIIDEWINITPIHHQHPWRDEILAGLAMVNKFVR